MSTSPEREKGVGPALPPRRVATVFAAVVTALGAAALVLHPSAAGSGAALSPPVLDLGGGECAVTADEAAPRAITAESDAIARMARYPFHPEDGVEAVRLLRGAIACSSTVGDTATVVRLESLEARWVARVQSDYRSRVVRVRIALERDSAPVAISEVKTLRRLLRRSTGGYVTWLEREQRRLERGDGE